MSNAGHILIPKHGVRIGQGFTKSEIYDSLVHPGRNLKGRCTAASWITELSDTRTSILLCSYCRTKFNPRRNKYRISYAPDPSGVTSGYVCNGQCDACKQPTENAPGGGVLFIAEEYWEQVCMDPQQARINARNAWRSPSRTKAIKQLYPRR